jgi:tryptophan synthase beta chain
MAMPETKVVLSEKDLPTQWYNLQADLPFPLPPVIHPGTMRPIGPDDLAPLFPMGLIAQEVSQDRWIAIPEPVRDIYRLWRPTPLYRAHRLEQALQTPARIYYKWEGVSPAGSHKPNTAVPQAYYNQCEGVKRLTTETGAGQWGSALALACRQFGLECKVYMVKISSARRTGSDDGDLGRAVPSPARHPAGRAVLAKDPAASSLGIAITKRSIRAMGDTIRAGQPNHVLMHQTVIGLRRRQFELLGNRYPGGCVGGGAFGGFTSPLQDKLAEGANPIVAEPTAPQSDQGRTLRLQIGGTPVDEDVHLGPLFIRR